MTSDGSLLPTKAAVAPNNGNSVSGAGATSAPPSAGADLAARVRAAAGELWRCTLLEYQVELPILRAKWRALALCILAQYAHGAAAQLAHRLHAPSASPLRDAGFALFPTSPPEWASEALFGCLFTLFILWSASPFWRPPRTTPFYTVTLWARTLTAVTACQALRCAAFLATGLPGPAPHCRAGVATSTRPMPAHWWGHAVVDVARQAGHGCGDLLFSSHTTFALSGALAYTYHSGPGLHAGGSGGGGAAGAGGSGAAVTASARRAHRARLAAVWGAVASLSLLIIASHKHYTVDVLVAWWTVPGVWALLERRWSSARGPGGRGVILRRCAACGGCPGQQQQQGSPPPAPAVGTLSPASFKKGGSGGGGGGSAMQLAVLEAGEAGSGGKGSSREGTPPPPPSREREWGGGGGNGGRPPLVPQRAEV